MPLSDIDHFLQINAQIATAGQPNAFQFGLIKAAHYDTVINLALSNSTNALADESAVVKSAWMEYLHIPVLWDRPALADFEFFCQIIKRRQNKRLFIHCAKNMRVSVFIYLWRRIYNHVSHPEAQATLEKIWIPNPIWQAFIQKVLEHHGISDRPPQQPPEESPQQSP